MHCFPRSAIVIAGLLVTPLIVAAADRITTRDDSVGRSLQEWFEKNSAAGFGALQYENRDGGHSLLPQSVYPKLRFRSPTQTEINQNADKGPPGTLRPEPTIGNCSMAGPPEEIGSLPRTLSMEQSGAAFIFNQYLHNNLYIYPEHLDYDPGANGIGGYGDMFPVNTACMLISQGSSGTDMPFVKAALAIAASFRPDIQRQLIRQHLLMPTLQAVFRQNSTLVKKEEDYFTGRAHPPVFPASAIDEMRMISFAQLMSPLSVPPAAFVEVLSERTAKPGQDFFERPEIQSEKLVTTPSFVGRVFRAMDETYELRLSARRSVDPDHRDLTFRWVLLQGEKDRVDITPSADGTEATVRVRWHPPMHAPTGIRTHRVDIGLFASNGIAWSAPAFLSVYMLPSEMRFFDDRGRLSELVNEVGDPDLELPTTLDDLRWLPLLRALAEAMPHSPLSEAFDPETRSELARAWKVLRPQAEERDLLPEQKRDAAGGLSGKLKGDLAKIMNARSAGGASVQSRVTEALGMLATASGLFLDHQEQILQLAAKSSRSDATTVLRAQLKRLTDLGVLVGVADGTVVSAHPREKLSACDRHCISQLNMIVLSHVLLPGVLERSPKPLFVDRRLGSRKTWRDVFHYDARGERTGWTRHGDGHVHRFNAAGLLLDDKDHAQPVNYRLDGGRLVFEAVAESGK